MDGAEWVQKFIDLHRPDAVRILDWCHAAEYLAKAGQAALGAGTSAASEWLGIQLHELKHGDPQQLLRNLRELSQELEATGKVDALKVLRGSLEYLEKRQEQIRYAEFQAMSYPIGSGAVESANKLVVEARLKGSGMHWARSHVDPMVALRTVVCSDRWDEAWPQISQRLREKAKEQRAGRRAKASPEEVEVNKPAPARVNTAARSRCKTASTSGNAEKQPAQVDKTPLAGRRPPAADHLWRRMAVGRNPSPHSPHLPSAKL